MVTNDSNSDLSLVIGKFPKILDNFFYQNSPNFQNFWNLSDDYPDNFFYPWHMARAHMCRMSSLLPTLVPTPSESKEDKIK